MINRSRLAALTAVLLLGASASSPVSATGTRTTDLPGTAGSADAGNSRRRENRPAAGVDPLYSRTALAPASDTLPGSPWLYADTDCRYDGSEFIQCGKQVNNREMCCIVYFRPGQKRFVPLSLIEEIEERS